MILTHSVEKWKITPTEKIFRQNTYLVISLVKLLLSRNFCQNWAGVNSRNFHTVWHKQITITWKISRQSNIECNVLNRYFHEIFWKNMVTVISAIFRRACYACCDNVFSNDTVFWQKFHEINFLYLGIPFVIVANINSHWFHENTYSKFWLNEKLNLK